MTAPDLAAGMIVAIEKGIGSFANRFLTVRVDRVRFPDGREGIYNVVGSPDGADVAVGAAMAILRAGTGDEVRYGLTRQFRYPTGKFSVEFPGGGITEHTAAEVLREVVEETGVVIDQIDQVTYLGLTHEMGAFWSAPTTLWLATTEHVPTAEHTDTETGGVALWVTEAELLDLIISGEMTDSASLAAWALYRIHHP